MRKLIIFNDCLRYSLFSLVKVYNDDFIYKYMIEFSIKGEMTARTVIGPDPTLKMGQICVPPQIASNLTSPVPVTHFNIKYLSDLVDAGKVNYVLKDNGQTRINLENALFFKGTRINHGDIIIRKNKITNEDEEIIVMNGKELLQKGDRLKRNGEWVTDIKYPEKRSYKINIGDICEVQLQNGSILLLNRQPTQMQGGKR